MKIDKELTSRLVTSQFPEWKDLPITPVALSGWDNRTFHLGDEMLIRMPSGPDYALQVEKEHHWLPKLVPYLPLPIPEPLAVGMPGEGYPWHWSIYRWLEGTPASTSHITDLNVFAKDLAKFLVALQKINTAHGPEPGLHNFYRGGPLSTYDADTRKAIDALKGKIDTDKALEIWEEALATSWDQKPVWLHGDMSPSNLLVQEGKLTSVIDFGQLGIGDPACDLAIAWSFFEGESQKVFREHLPLDRETWARGRGWCLWKFLVVAAGFTKWDGVETHRVWEILDGVINPSGF